MKKITYFIVVLLLLSTVNSYAQVGKDGARTISAANTIVNEYTYLTANAASGGTALTVNNNNLNTNSRFSGPLAQGDLILIIQMQGVTVDATPLGAPFATYSLPNSSAWGNILNYNNCGNYEFCQVLSVAGTNTINILCGLRYSYTSAGHVQIIRVPRYTTLTVNNSLTGENWNGNTGGVVAVEVQTTTTLNAGGSIVSTGIGFRPGSASENLSGYGAGQFANDDGNEGSEKGESVAGFTTEYNVINGQFCMGAAANGGGGGNGHNAGGGGGGNGGSTAAWTGLGVSNPAFNAAWALEPPMLGSVSSGGGRGGHSFSNNNLNATTTAPNDAAWGGDANRNVGGLGGRPLDYSSGKLFIGGGGGAGDQNDGDAGGGGRGGGLVFIMSYGTVGGTGTINANGNAGASSIATGGAFLGRDGAGGGGAGGTVVINSNSTISGITINANGGAGGNQNFHVLALGNDAYGPGGGGGGGYISISNGTPTRNANGGANGTTNSLGFTEFPPKGATSGNTGSPTEAFSNYFFTLANQTICYNTTATLTATITGTVPGGVTLNWYTSQFGTVAAGSGTTFTTPALTTTTTYWVGFCPGHYRLPVTVTVGPQIVINTSGMVITNETCAGNNGSITGITASGGTGTLDYTWNGTPSTLNITGQTAGSYTLVATDDNGCTATSGPHVIGSSGGPTLNTASMVITNATCGNSNGSITGITGSGGTGALTYTWNGTPSPTNLTSAAPGSYTIVVTDAVGCSSSAGPFTIGNTGGVTINATGVVVTNNTCGLTNGSITGITASSPAGGLVYTWNATITPSANLTGVVGGSYTLVVTDAAGCSATTGPYTILNQPGPTISTASMVITQTSCGLNNGSITGITASGGTGTLDYTWNGTPSTLNISSLPAGNYTLVVTDDNGCTATSGPHTINPSSAPSLNTASMVITNASCGLNNGSITGITGSGGTGALTYEWNGSPSPANLTGVGPGSYTIEVTDAAGCSATAGPFAIINNGGVTINTAGLTITPASCGSSNGSITGIIASSPAGGLVYVWNATTTPSADLTASPAGSYTLTVTDGAGCSATTGPHIITNAGGPVIDTTAMVITNESCAGNDGSIVGISISGGTGTLDIDWNGTITGSANHTNLTSGTYTLTVTDDNGCTATTGPLTVGTASGINIDASAVSLNDPTCGNSNGSITGIVVSGGTGLLTYDWSGTAFTTPDMTGGGPGAYTLTVTDAGGCTATAGPFTLTNNGGVTINTTSMVIADATCGNLNGSITGIVALSSAGGLTYEWNSVPNPDEDITGIGGGTYVLEVTDAAGCSATIGPLTVQNIGAPTITTTSMTITNTSCGLSNGAISGIVVSGGSGTLTYDWNGTPAADQNLTNAPAGSYTLTVTDTSGCAQSAGPFTIDPSNTLVAGATGTNASCFGYTDGSASGSVTGGNGTITYTWIGGPVNQNYTGIPAGTYQVIVSDSQGCDDTASVTITEPASFNPNITGTSTICEGQSTTLTASGGGTYVWSTSGTGSSITVSPTTTTTYIVDVTNGVCTESDSVTVTVNPLPVASISGTITICEGQSTTLTANGGSTYEWSDSSTGTSINVSPTSTTNYFVIATNACGSDTATVTVTVGGAFSVDAGPDQTIGLGNSATLSASGGVSWVWDPGSMTGQTVTVSPTSTTTYTVTATSSSGCTDTSSVTVIVDATIAIFVPDIFAPNGNGVNDFLFVRGSGIESLKFSVYDRWGQKVFETENISEGWDGNFRNKPLDTGVFVYTLKGHFMNGEEFDMKGNVTLKR